MVQINCLLFPPQLRICDHGKHLYWFLVYANQAVCMACAQITCDLCYSFIFHYLATVKHSLFPMGDRVSVMYLCRFPQQELLRVSLPSLPYLYRCSATKKATAASCGWAVMRSPPGKVTFIPLSWGKLHGKEKSTWTDTSEITGSSLDMD